MSTAEREALEGLARAIAELWSSEDAGGHRHSGHTVVATLDTLDLLDLDLIASSVGGVADPFGQLQDWIAEQLEALGEWIVSSISGIFQQIADAIQSALSTALDFIMDAISSLAANVAAGFTQLAETIQSVIVTPLLQALQWVQDFFPQLVEAAQSLIYTIQEAVGEIYGQLQELVAGIAEQVSSALQSILEAVAGIASQVAEALQQLPGIVAEVAETLASMLQAALEQAQQLAAGVAEALASLAEQAQQTLASMVEALVDTLQSALATLADMVSTAVQGVSEALSSLAETLSTMISSVVDQASAVLQSMIEAVQAAVASIAEALGQIPALIASAVEQVAASLAGLAETVANILQGIVETLSGWVSSLQDMLSAALQAVAEQLQGLAQAIQSAIQSMVEAASSAFQQLVDMIANAASSAAEALQSILQAIAEAGSQLVDTMAQAMQGLADMLQSTLQAVAEQLQGFAEQVAAIAAGAAEALTTALQGMVEAVSQQLQQLAAGIQQATAQLAETVASLAQQVVDALQQLPAAVAEAAEQLLAQLQEMATGMAEALQGIADAIQQIPGIVSEAVEAIAQSISSLAEQAAKTLEGWLATVHAGLQQVMDTLAQLPQFISRAMEVVEESLRNLPSIIVSAVEDVTSWIWENLPEWARRFLEEAPKALERVGVALTGFINAILKFPEWFPSWFTEYISKPIVEALRAAADAVLGALEGAANALASAVATAVDAVRALADALAGFFTDPWRYIGPALEWLAGGAQWLGEKLYEVGRWLFDTAVALGKGIWELVQGIVAKIADALVSAATWFYDTFLVKPLTQVADALSKTVQEVMLEALKRRGEGGELWFLLLLMAQMMARMMPVYSLPWVIGGIFEIPAKVKLSAKPMGVGAEAEAQPTKFVQRLMDFFKEIGKHLAQGTILGMSFNIFDPYKYLIRPPAKALMDPVFMAALGVEAFFEAPTVTQMRDILRRSMVHVEDFSSLIQGKLPENFKRVYDTATRMFEVYGYPRWFIEYYLDLGQKFSMIVQDRFGGQRVIPFSPLFEIPTRSEIVRMLQRDVFASPMEWTRFVKVYGMSDDLAKMYYMLSFDYPSFSQLWEFFVRGISGMLWYQPPEFIAEWFSRDAAWLGAGTPAPPRSLNYDYNALFKAIPFYLKWIQKSNFSWFRKGSKIRYGDMEITIDFDWTADSWLLWDISADLPGKIDARWMAKWALFDLISARAGVGTPTPGGSVSPYPEIPFVDLVTTVVEDTVASSIMMDLRAFSRLLVANGLHPAWVPITAVAEAINALSEERTLLRTGFMNLFKEGFWDYETIDTLLDGFFTASFAVEYFDPRERKWKAGAVNVPVKFLPAERRLLELRAAMDRALDILRDLVRELNRAYAENLVGTHEEYMASLSEGVSLTNKWFKPLIRELTGKELELLADTAYWEAYAKVLEHYRAIYTMRRIRYWIGRIITWSIYRLAAEYITVEDVKEIVNTFSSYGRLTSEEVEMIEKIMETMVGLAKREYIPTPSQLATIAEIVPEAVEKMQEVFEKRHVPEEWRPIWARYIQVKPIASDVRSLLTAYRRARVYGVPLGELEEKIISLAKEAGWTDRELEILALRIRLEELIAETREMRRAYLPTPTMLATLAEYIEIPAELVREALEKRGVPEAWTEIWIRYIEIRPLADEARLLATVYFKAVRYGVPLGKLGEEALKTLRELGFSERELRIRELRAAIEAAIDEWREAQREYIPTPSMLATIAEIVPAVVEKMEEVFEARHVPDEWRPIWRQYILAKPIASDVRSLLSAYRRAKVYGVELGELEQRILELAKQTGWTERELEILALRITVEEMIAEARELRRAYLPTPSMLATLAEYVEVPASLVEKALEARRVPDEWRSLWIRYIEVRPLADEARLLATVYFKAVRYGVPLGELADTVLETLRQLGFSERELRLRELRATIEAMIDEWREAQREYIPSPLTLASMAEVVPEVVEKMEEVFDARRVPEAWRPLWSKYIMVKPISGDVRSLLTAYARAKRYRVPLGDLEQKILDLAREAGWTDRELEILLLRATVEELIDEAMLLRREYLPTPQGLAILAEYVEVPRELVEQVLERRGVPEEWRSLWIRYIEVRPLADEAKMLATAYFRAKRYGVPLGELGEEIERLLRELGFSEEELRLRELRAAVEAAIDEWREAQRQYIPTPSMLASIAEVVPEARALLAQVLEARRVPEEWRRIWERYVQLRPIINEVRRYATAALLLYEYFAVTKETVRRALEQLKQFGYEDEEIMLMISTSDLRRARRAYQRLVGTPRQLITLAEYSPMARRVALAEVYKMIDALPTDPQTKEFLKKMWEEYIRVRPVYDEVRRYITELLSDYANGVITREQLEAELEELKAWGIDDYEVQFYLWLAEKRRIRYLARRRY